MITDELSNAAPRVPGSSLDNDWLHRDRAAHNGRTERLGRQGSEVAGTTAGVPLAAASATAIVERVLAAARPSRTAPIRHAIFIDAAVDTARLADRAAVVWDRHCSNSWLN